MVQWVLLGVCSACGGKHEAWWGRIRRGAWARDSCAEEESRRLPLSHHARHRLWRHIRSATATWHSCNHVTTLLYHVTRCRRAAYVVTSLINDSACSCLWASQWLRSRQILYLTTFLSICKKYSWMKNCQMYSHGYLCLCLDSSLFDQALLCAYCTI